MKKSSKEIKEKQTKDQEAPYEFKKTKKKKFYIIEKIKDLFDVVKYRSKYNTMENKYNTLKREYNEKILSMSDRVLKAVETNDSLQSTVKKISTKQTEMNQRLIEVENAKKSRKTKSTDM